MIQMDDPNTTMDDNVCVVNGVAYLRAWDANGNADSRITNPLARFSNDGYLTTRNMKIEALENTFWGFEAEYDIPDDAEIRVEFSVDRGVTWLGDIPIADVLSWFNGGAGNYLAPREIMLRFHLIPSSDNLKTPMLRRVFFYGDVVYDPVEDVLRTISRLLREEMTPKLRFNLRTGGGNTLVLDSHFNLGTVEVYRPEYRDVNHDLFQSYDFATKTITLNTALNNGEKIELRAEIEIGRDNVKNDPDPDYVNTTVPIYVIRNLNALIYEDGLHCGREIEKRILVAEKKGRIQEVVTPIDVQVAIDCAAPTEIEASALANSLRDLLRRHDTQGLWQSVGMGYYFDIVEVEPVDDVSLSDEKFHDYQVRFVVGAKEYTSTILETPLAETIEIGIIGNEKVEVL